MLRLAAGVLLWLLACCASAATYTFRSDSYSWETASTAIAWDRTCTSYPGDDDKATITFTGGFTFTFAGTAYSSVRVLSNGILQFGADTGLHRTYTNTTLPIGTPGASSTGCARAATTLALIAYWTDLNPAASGSGGVTWQQKGTAPNRYVVVSWNAVYQYNTSTPYTFQVILYENGEFKYQYGNANASGSNATIGVQVSGTDYTLYSYNSGYNANGSAIRWSVASTTPTRQAEYRFDEYGYSGTIGEVRDSSGNARHGVRVGSATTTASGQVCRALDIASNTSATTRTAADTLVSPASGLGNSGALSFFYFGNTSWNAGNAATLMDATLNAARPFYVVRNSGGTLSFGLADGAGTRLTVTSTAQNIAARRWTHVAVTWRLAAGTNQSTLRVYVGGVLVGTAIGTTNGMLDPGLGTLFAGDNRSSAIASGASANSANGAIDELRLYNYEITLAEIAADMVATHSCAPPVDHYEVSVPSSTIACLGSTVTVTACADSSSPCTNPSTGVLGQTASLSASGGASVSPLITFDATGRATAALAHATASNGTVAAVSLSNEQTPGSNPRQCCPDGVACSAANSCSSTFHTAGFLFAASTGGPAATIPAHTAGTRSSTWFLRAVKTNASTQACEAALAGPNTVHWAHECSNPGTCSGGNRMTVHAAADAAIASNPASGVSGRTPVTMNFDSNGNAPFAFTHGDVGLTLFDVSKASAGTQLTPLVGRSNGFVTKPAGFVLSGIRCSSYSAGQCATGAIASPGNNPGAGSATGAAFMPAGRPFSVTVTAVGSTGATTPNFGRESTPEGVSLSSTLVAPAGGQNPVLANASGFGSFSNGVASGSGFSWSEVGIITLTPRVADGDYLGAGPVVGSASGNVGRFVPAALAVSGAALTLRDGQSCSPASSFGYLGENTRFTLTLSALSAAGGVTQNYAGAFAKFDPAAGNWNLVGTDGGTVFSTASGRLSMGLGSGSFSAGVAANVALVAAALRGSSPDGPFNASFGIAPLDSDGVGLASFDMPASGSGANDRLRLGSAALVFGRLRVGNAIGAADRPLDLPVHAQHWNGAAWVTQVADSCTRVPAASVNMGNLRGTLTTADTAVSAPVVMAAGTGTLRLAAPGAGRSGTLDLALSLGSSATDASCLQTWAPGSGDAATAGANLAFLRGAWCSASHGQDPSARATFGRRRDAGATMHRREMY